ncbi:hypothetical protein [Actinopolyspora erythraea]|uniref:hypothetical protein n=1 Tax=Actinopolyspora erythraea TaxID=414996 RepID=UPI0012B5793D|nr:hypothetical protein [Actinopolyspora erythraea]
MSRARVAESAALLRGSRASPEWGSGGRFPTRGSLVSGPESYQIANRLIGMMIR